MLSAFRENLPRLYNLIATIFSRENLLALVIALILIVIFITTAADAPIWLYQGF